MNMHELLQSGLQTSLHYSIKIALALLIFLIGRIVASLISKGVHRTLSFRHIDSTISLFAQRVTYTLIIIISLIAALSQLGIQTTSLVAILGALGLAIGLSLKNSLSNLATGILLVVFRPFKVGDFIEIGHIQGQVIEVSLMFTRILTPQNPHAIVPNNRFSNEILTNYSKEPLRRAELIIGISYEDNIQKAREIIKKIIVEDPHILQTPKAPVITVKELGESSVNLLVRYWTHRDHHFTAMGRLHEAIKTTFDEQGISMPYPQRVLHYAQNPENTTT